MEYFTYRRFKTKGIDGEFNPAWDNSHGAAALHAPTVADIMRRNERKRVGALYPHTFEGVTDKDSTVTYKFYGQAEGGVFRLRRTSTRRRQGAQNLYWKTSVLCQRRSLFHITESGWRAARKGGLIMYKVTSGGEVICYSTRSFLSGSR